MCDSSVLAWDKLTVVGAGWLLTGWLLCVTGCHLPVDLHVDLRDQLIFFVFVTKTAHLLGFVHARLK